MRDKIFYTNNRKRLIAAYGSGVIVVAGNGLMQRSADTTYLFRQDSNVLYLTGLQEPGITLVIDVSTKKEFLIIPSREGVAAIFDGVLDEAFIKQQTGIGTILSEKEGFTKLRILAKSKKLYFNIPTKSLVGEINTNPHRQRVYAKLKKMSDQIYDIRPEIAKLRVIKQPAEIVILKKAIKITKDALKSIDQLLRTSTSEAELLNAISVYFAKKGVEHAYGPIVAAGNNATTLHYIKNNSNFVLGDAVLFDIGAEVEGYAADISRTYTTGVKSNTRPQIIINEVTQIQKALIAFVKPGITWEQLSQLSEKLVGESLAKLGVTDNKADTRKYFPHAIGHFLGLDVHDVGDYTQPLAEGMVITIEPGIYIPEEGIGVRIEDDILITKTGSKML